MLKGFLDRHPLLRVESLRRSNSKYQVFRLTDAVDRRLTSVLFKKSMASGLAFGNIAVKGLRFRISKPRIYSLERLEVIA